MLVGELIDVLNKLPPETKILINGEVGWYDLLNSDTKYMKVFLIWHSDWDNNGTPYESFDNEPKDSVYVRGNNKPDYVRKTIGEDFILLLG